MMTNDKKARLLALYRENAFEIQRLDRELEAYAKRLDAAWAVGIDCANYTAIQEHGNALLQRLSKASRERATAERMVCAVEDVRHRTLLTLHYLDGLTWTETAEAMGYDIRYIFRMRGKALEALEILEG